MKYRIENLLILVSLFLVAEVFGVWATGSYFKRELPYGLEAPKWEPEVAPIAFMIILLLATALMIFLIRKRVKFFLGAWFFLAIFLCSSVGLASFLPESYALGMALILTILRFKERDIYIHNLSEMLSYVGVTAIFLPLFTPITVVILLIAISIYDFLAVYKTKHMIKMFEYQKGFGILLGLFTRYKDEVAFLGGGDVVFVMLFSAVMAKFYSFAYGLISIYLAALTIFLIGIFGEKKKFYPAMPFLTSSCLLSFLIANAF